MNDNKGSEWRKWDLHLHTASSYDYEYKANDSDELLVKSLKSNNISAIAITDHFVIDKKRINNLRTLDQEIVIFPGVELRTDKGDTNIHVILIFNEKYNIDNLSEDFNVFKRSKAKYPDDDHKTYWDFNDILDFANTHEALISIHAGSKTSGVDDKISNVLAHNQAVKTEFAECVHIFEMGKISDLEDYRKFVFPTIGEKPMIICSDNHNPRNYSLKINCWIKADPTFEGLKQILCEPNDRIAIQESHPEEKKNYNIIDSIKFVDPSKNTFQPERIELNSGLNAIIGGKSSGKSLLLNMMAAEIGATNTKVKEYKDLIKDVKVEIYYKDEPTIKRNNSDDRKIEFLPQLYINDLISNKENKETTDRSFNTFIEELIRQDDEIKSIMDKANAIIASSLSTIDSDITEWTKLDNQLTSKKEERKKLGDKKAIENEVKRIISEIDDLKANAGWTEDEKNEYNKLIQENKDNTTKQYILKQENLEAERLKLYLNKQIKSEILKAVTFSSEAPAVKYIMGGFKAYLSDLIEKEVTVFVSKVSTKIEANNKLIESSQEYIIRNNSLLEPLVSKNKIQVEIEKKEKIKLEEETKITQIKEKDSEITDIRNKIEALQFISHYQIISDTYYQLATSLNSAISIKWNEEETKLKIKASTVFKSAVFVNSITGIVKNQSYLSNQFNREGHTIFEINDYNYNKDNHINNLIELLRFAIQETDRYTNFKNGKNSKEFLASLLKDCFTIEYDVIKNNDSLHKMSEGKKGIVVLQLYLSLSGSDCPILIDQPEDNLDNRTVYQELNDYIKQCKKRRQIIMVSHNANLVVNTDAENVIVANQSGEDNKDNKKYKFEYVNGALELSFRDDSQKGVLYKQGIREHVCEILEGGVDAFKKREKKYHIEK